MLKIKSVKFVTEVLENYQNLPWPNLKIISKELMRKKSRLFISFNLVFQTRGYKSRNNYLKKVEN